MSEPFLLEIGCEEIPARMIAAAADDLCQRVTAVLDAAGLSHGPARAWGGTRRLAVRVESVSATLAGKDELVLGPAASVAFKDDGMPTPAAVGFAKRQGIDPATLQRVTTDKGVYAAFRRQVAERTLEQVLAGALPAAVSAMTFPKSMRWGAGTHRFVRPVHWVVALHGGAVVNLEILGATAGRRSVLRDPPQLSRPLHRADHEAVAEEAPKRPTTACGMPLAEADRQTERKARTISVLAAE